ncbi:hypothetical protein K3495_g15942, partial [Podosphaera aphanis]
VTSLSKQSQDRYEENANIKRSDAPLYKVGDQVIVNTQNMQLGRPVSKPSPKWEGPFKVVKSSSHAVTLKLPQNMKITPTFHVSLIQPFPMERFSGQKDEDVHANKGRIIQRTDNHEEVIEYRFDEIMDYGKADNGHWQYLIKWTDHAPSWQPATDLRGCDDAIWHFHDAHPDNPNPPNWVKRRRSKK